MFPNKKVPGNVLPPARKQSQGYIDDLANKQKFELEELLERQNKLLACKNFVSKLPDKGKRIKDFRDRILKELQHKDEIEKAANLLSRLNIACEGKAAMTKLEWTGKYDNDVTKVVELDSDDEEDPLKILAQPTGAGVHKKKIIHVVSEESLIKPEDLDEIKSFETDPLNVQHVRYIVDKVEKARETKREPFRPYKTTKSNVHDPMKEKQRKLPENWEATAATPPLIVHGAAKVLSLDESFRLQQEQTEKRKIVQAKYAIERLTGHIGTHTIGPAPKNVGNYRMNDSSPSSSSEDEADEVHDEEDNDKGGTVVFTVDSIES
ncbi:hypothetical protein DMN91_002349 [Ooceraea biroi]|uniref:Uncharacterized protein n=1 Tax=Ooceraea biroi TaxID=2015173 RepID=A0A026W427_OOCBI|nr:DNA-directed RNA polymerase II subunit GRINL1A [Ooceraea biroi]XP_011344366.1 DNA-directed RNA polymerase II subunit GRINL1A [Ooceraea biroi]XP_011344367.1 DNA-directed RNA polymerase II subunit GRINL1A [Ooceraea biroi]XP_011344368.1 DNA-directed RNA polymerase II subunit GRINL1A [Ooceraea biroi]XP_011344369.1 DNA-directed RNA polymerase II subunit GRINL1A [Ooceraea biroi]EZA50840.1 hypothetical protein X777_10473 [Ooceraea biroi]RLU26183.1 hypothetical protein DMN91_002349 [Ooceraea biroi